MKLLGDDSGSSAVGAAFKFFGDQGFLLSLLVHLLQRPPEQRFPYELPRLYARLGKKEEGLKWLEKAYAEHRSGMLFSKSDPVLDSWRSDPRFQSLQRRMNFPE